MSELLLPKTMKLIAEMKEANRLRIEQWHRLDETIVYAVVEQSTRMLLGKPAHKKATPRKFIKVGSDQAKVDARVAVHNAVAKGVIQKPKNCTICKRKRRSDLLEAHHEDYSRPLDVIWLCRRCHCNVHANGPSVISVGA